MDLIPAAMEEDNNHPYEEYPTTNLPCQQNSPTPSSEGINIIPGPGEYSPIQVSPFYGSDSEDEYGLGQGVQCEIETMTETS